MHPPFLIGHLFALGYQNMEPFFICQDGWFSSYFSIASIDKTSKIGVELYSSKKSFRSLVAEWEEYESRLRNSLERILRKESLTREDGKDFALLVKEYWDHFQKTEFFYLDAAFNYSKTHKETAENLQKFGDFKYKAREYGNLLLYTGPKYFENILRKISVQLGLDYRTVSNCSKDELLDLFNGISPKKDYIDERLDSHVFFKEKGQICFLTGKMSRRLVKEFLKGQTSGSELKGTIACKGKARGRVKILITNTFDDFDSLVNKIHSLKNGEIVVAETTTPEFTPAMEKAAAILTAQGGMMSHAAIVSREMNKPCIVGISNITRILKDGDVVEVDAENGIVKIIE